MAENNVQAYSSRGGTKRFNEDGTVNVYCPRCTRFICTVSDATRFSSANCVFCEAADRGETLPQEVIDQVQLVKMPDGRQLPRNVIYPDPVTDPMVGDEAAVGRVGYFFRNISKIAAIAKTKIIEPVSKSLSRAKRRQPVLKGGLLVNLKIDPEHTTDDKE